MPCITNLAKTTDLNAKINEAKNKIPNITNLDTITTAFTAVENKIPAHSIYTTPEFSKLTAEKICCKISTSKFIKQK